MPRKIKTPRKYYVNVGEVNNDNYCLSDFIRPFDHGEPELQGPEYKWIICTQDLDNGRKTYE